MATCRDCNQEMLTATSCTVDVLVMNGERFERNRVGTPVGPADRCGDCGVKRRGYHHFGCDLELCPRCRNQLISCGCCWADEDTESLVLVADGTVVYPGGLKGLRVSSARHPFGDFDEAGTTGEVGS